MLGILKVIKQLSKQQLTHTYTHTFVKIHTRKTKSSKGNVTALFDVVRLHNCECCVINNGDKHEAVNLESRTLKLRILQQIYFTLVLEFEWLGRLVQYLSSLTHNYDYNQNGC